MTECVLTTDAVRHCIDELVELPVHRHFPGYLCNVREAGSRGNDAGLEFEYTQFFEAFFKGAAGGDKPYIVPFRAHGTDDWSTLQFNRNVGGTCAPLSRRNTSPLCDVATVEGERQNATWTLADGHWILARTHFPNSAQVPVEALAGFLFRDYALSTQTPTGETLVDKFCEEFYYGRESKAFQHLYSTSEFEIATEDFNEQ